MLYFYVDTTVTPDLPADQATKVEDTDQNTTEARRVEGNTTSGLSLDESLDEDSISLDEQDYIEHGNFIQSELKQADNRSTSTDDQDEIVGGNNYGINPRLKCKYLKIHQINK